MEKETQVIVTNEVSIKDLGIKILSKWYIIVAAVLAAVLVAVIYLNFFTVPLYSSMAKIYVFNTETSNIVSSELTISTYLVKDYSELIADDTVLNEVIENLDLNYTSSALRGAISINNPKGTRILEITVKTPEPKLSQKIADEICEVSKEKIVELMGVSRVNIISKATLSKNSFEPNVQKVLLTAVVIAFFLSITMVGLFYILSDKIYDEEDVEKYLGLSVLSTIPYTNPGVYSSKNTQKHKGRKS